MVPSLATLLCLLMVSIAIGSHATERQQTATADQTASTQMMILRGAAARPIITGCLQECGVQDQSCTTECEVCVEEHQCLKVTQDCGECLEQAQQTRKLAKFNEAEGQFMADSGGAPMVHDDIRTELVNAKLMSVDGKQKLRQARDAVLQAQRNAEWSAAERAEQAQKLHAAKNLLKDDEDEVTEWKLHNEKAGKKHRAKLKRKREEQHSAEKRLRKTMKELERAEGMTDDDENSTSTKEQLQQEVVEERKAVKKAEKAAEEASQDAGWIDRELQKEMSESKRNVKRNIKDLKMARALERMSRERLEEAKKRYREASKASQKLEANVVELEARIHEHPLPYNNAEVRFHLHNLGKRMSGPSALQALCVALAVARVVLA